MVLLCRKNMILCHHVIMSSCHHVIISHERAQVWQKSIRIRVNEYGLRINMGRHGMNECEMQRDAQIARIDACYLRISLHFSQHFSAFLSAYFSTFLCQITCIYISSCIFAYISLPYCISLHVALHISLHVSAM